MQILDDIRPERIVELCTKIDMPLEVTEKIALVSEEFDFSRLSAPYELLFNVDTGAEGVKAIEESLRQHEDRMFIWLVVWLAAALRTHGEYRHKGIDDTVFYNTMGCFSRFVKEHKASYGVYGYDRSSWTYRQIAMRIFRIGTLEYEMCRHRGDDIRFGGETLRSGENKLSVHIPSDARLDGVKCHDSYRMAVSFFSAFYPQFQYDFFYTNTWLLSPALKLLLDEDSGILNFQKDYTIFSIDEDNPSFQGWVFKNTELRPEDYPENTSLQRNIKRHILSGGKIGSGSGIIRKERFME